jgi:hypothetical protein
VSVTPRQIANRPKIYQGCLDWCIRVLASAPCGLKLEATDADVD